MDQQRVMIGCPSHDGRIDRGTAEAMYAKPSKGRHLTCAHVSVISLIGVNCNQILCNALNDRRRLGLDWVAIIHSDIEPEWFWLDKLLDVAEETNADFVSAVVPVKSDEGVVSTAIASNVTLRPFCRLSTGQVYHRDFPKSFDLTQAADALESLPHGYRIDNVPRHALLCNTGCCIIRLEGLDVEQAWFDDRCMIHNNGSKLEVYTQSEDWFFTAKLAKAGRKVVATTTVKLEHKGITAFPSHDPWGKPVDDLILSRPAFNTGENYDRRVDNCA